MKMICDFCKKEFERTEKEAAKSKTHFCRRECHSYYAKEHSTSTKERCSYCGKDVFRNNCRKKNSKTGIYFCDVLCRNRFLAKKSKLNTNPHSHKRRRQKVFEKANYICQKCGYNEDRRMFDIHHNDGNHKNNMWDNFRCICAWCHIKHHRGVDVIAILPPLFENSVGQETEFTEENKRYRSPTKVSEINPLWKKKQNIKARKVEWPTKEELEKIIWEKSTEKIGKDFGVSGAAVAKWCKRYSIKKPPRGYWAKIYAKKI